MFRLEIKLPYLRGVCDVYHALCVPTFIHPTKGSVITTVSYPLIRIHDYIPTMAFTEDNTVA